MLNNPKKPLYWREYLLITPAVVINAGWVTVASFVGLGVCFKKFEIVFQNESFWAIIGLIVLLGVFSLNSFIYGGFLLGGVFVFVNYALFDKYNTDKAKRKK